MLLAEWFVVCFSKILSFNRSEQDLRMGGSVSSPGATVKAEAHVGSSVPPQGCPMHQARQESKSIAKLWYSLIPV